MSHRLRPLITHISRELSPLHFTSISVFSNAGNVFGFSQTLFFLQYFTLFSFFEFRVKLGFIVIRVPYLILNFQPLVDPSYAPVNDELSLEDQKRLIEPIFEELANCYNWACTALNAQQLYPFVSALSYNDILRSQRIGYYARVLRQMGYEMKMVGLMMKGVIKDTKNGHASPVIFQGVKSKKRYMEVIAGIYEVH